MAKLSAICMKLDYFRKIVSTKIYECVGRSKHDVNDEPRSERKRKVKQREQGENFFGKFDTVSPKGKNLKFGKDQQGF
jgi:hypothetical protein